MVGGGMRQLRKEFFRSLHNTWLRYLSMVLIVALGVAFFSGVRSAEPDMQISADAFFDDSSLWDIRVICAEGMKEEDLEKIRDIQGVAYAEGSYNLEALCDDGEELKPIKVMALNEEMNQVTLQKGKMPKKDTECLLDSAWEGKGCRIGDKISIKTGTDVPLEYQLAQAEYTITGFVTHPYYLSMDRGTASIGNGDLSGFVMVPASNFETPFTATGQGKVYSEAFVRVEGVQKLNCYGEEYEDEVEQVSGHLEKLNEQWYVLNRNSIQAYQEYGQDTNRIGAIGKVFPLIFFLVAALVSLTTITRMVEEERTQIGTLKALGYGRGAIAAKYILYGCSGAIIGSMIGIAVGYRLLPYVIITAYGILYSHLPEILTPLQAGHAISSTLVAVLCTTLAALAACYKELRSVPAQLMRPVSPKNGKRVFLERIGFLWRRLRFSQKATMRNLIRYKKRFLMTVFGIGGCTALILVGFGLKDSIVSLGELQFGHVTIYDANIMLDVTQDTDAVYEELQKDATDILYIYENSFDIGKGDIIKSSYFIVPKDKQELHKFMSLQDRRTGDKQELSEDGIIITEKLAKLLDAEVGDTVYLKESDTSRIEVKVTAISENYFMHYIYMSPSLYEELFGEAPVYNCIFANLKDVSDKYEEAFFEKYSPMEGVSGISFTSGISDRVHNMLKSMDPIIVVLVVAAGLLSFVVLFNLNNINIGERIRELATIKVLGFYDEELAWYVYRENIWLTAIGVLLGLGLGVVLHQFVIATAEIDLLMFTRNIDLSSFVYAIVLTFVFAVLVNLAMYRKLRRIDMIQSLKSVE